MRESPEPAAPWIAPGESAGENLRRLLTSHHTDGWPGGWDACCLGDEDVKRFLRVLADQSQEQRCRTCKHWTSREPDDIRGICEAIDYTWLSGRRDEPGEPALIGVGDDCHGILYTTPDFGCRMWEPTPEKN